MGLIKWIKSKFSKPVSIKPTDEIIMYSKQSGHINLGKKLIVPEGYICLLVAKEKVADRFMAGEHTLSVENLPALTRLLKLNVPNKKGKYKETFFADIYFVKLGEKLNNNFCSQQGIYVKKDKEFLGTTAFVKGKYDFKIADPILLLEAMLKVYGKFNGSLAQRQIDIWTGELVDKKTQKNKPNVQRLYERDSSCFVDMVEFLNKNTKDIGLEYTRVVVETTILPMKVYQRANLKYDENIEPKQETQSVPVMQNIPQEPILPENNAKKIDFFDKNEEFSKNEQINDNFNASQSDNSLIDFGSEIKSFDNAEENVKKSSQDVDDDYHIDENYDLNTQNEQNIEEMQSKISYKKCKNCGAFNSKDAVSCFNCKSSFKKVCGHCGAEIDDGDFVCPKCKSVVI